MSSIKFKPLFKLAQHVRNDFVNLGKNVHKLDSIGSYQEFAGMVSQIKKEDFSIDKNYFKNNNIHMYSSSVLFETPNNDICFGLFLLPKGYYIPMHDHPSMWVITKILHGSARKVSYSIADRSQIKHQFLFPKKVQQLQQKGLRTDNLNNPSLTVDKQFDNVVSEGILDVVRPEVGNLHEFLATEDQDFVFLNCFIPHYDDKHRFTTFYDIEDPIAKRTEAKMHAGVPDHYQKKVLTLDMENMPFFESEFKDQRNMQPELKEYIERTEFFKRRQQQVKEDREYVPQPEENQESIQEKIQNHPSPFFQQSVM